jgi:hypothetical protein
MAHINYTHYNKTLFKYFFSFHGERIQQLLFSAFDLNGPSECAFTVNGLKSLRGRNTLAVKHAF